VISIDVCGGAAVLLQETAQFGAGGGGPPDRERPDFRLVLAAASPAVVLIAGEADQFAVVVVPREPLDGRLDVLAQAVESLVVDRSRQRSVLVVGRHQRQRADVEAVVVWLPGERPAVGPALGERLVHLVGAVLGEFAHVVVDRCASDGGKRRQHRRCGVSKPAGVALPDVLARLRQVIVGQQAVERFDGALDCLFDACDQIRVGRPDAEIPGQERQHARGAVGGVLLAAFGDAGVPPSGGERPVVGPDALGPGAVFQLRVGVESGAGGVPVREVDAQVLVDGQQVPCDFGVVAEPGVAVAAGVDVVWVVLRPLDACARRGSEQGERPQVAQDGLPMGDVGHVELVAAHRAVADGSVGLVVVRERADVCERVRARRLLVVRDQRDQRRLCEASLLVERYLRDHGVREVVAGTVTGRQRDRVVGQQLVEPLAALVDDPVEPRRGGEVVVLGVVEHLDDVVVEQVTDAARLAVRRERHRGDQAHPVGDVTAQFDVREMGPFQRVVVLVNGVLPGVVFGDDHRRLALVRLAGRLQFVEPGDVLSGADAEPRALDAVLVQGRSRIVTDPSRPVDVHQPSVVAREQPVRGGPLTRVRVVVASVALVLVDRDSHRHTVEDQPPASKCGGNLSSRL